MPRRGLDGATVVEAAARIADDEGLEAVSVARVAGDLGVRAPSLYNHVAGLDGLRRGIAVRALGELGDALRSVTVGRAGTDALTALARAYRAYAHAHPGSYAATQWVPGAGDEEHAHAAGAVVGVVLGVLRAWGVEGEEAIHATRAIRSALHGFVTIEQGGGFGLDVDVEDSFDWLVARLSDGLTAAAPGPGRPR
jgi:AcrR family transcriptional regulator